jgi:GNAT superfamily N-acetyltransferase
VSSFELASYEPSNFEDYVGLLGQVWGHQGLSAEEFAWWFLDNPAGSLMSVAKTEGRVVGVAGHTLLRMVIGGEQRLASFSVHATTLPEARGLGIFRELELKHEREAQERGVAVVLAFASAPTAPLFLGPLGWTRIAKLRIWARPALRWKSEPLPGPFDFEGDAAAAWPNHVVRDSEHLTWRYARSPRGYWVLRSSNGYAAVWPRKGHRGRSIAVLADLAAPADEQHDLLVRAAHAAHAHVLFGLPAPGQRAAFLAAGFLPTHLTLDFMGKPLAGRLDTDPRRWRFTLGDTDFF